MTARVRAAKGDRANPTSVIRAVGLHRGKDQFQLSTDRIGENAR
jgi:hypothetical protein